MIGERQRAAIDGVLGADSFGWGSETRAATGGRVSRGGAALRERRHLLLPALQAAQRAAGWVTPEALEYLHDRLGIAPADSYGVATFYDLIDTAPGQSVRVRVCDDIACSGITLDGLGDDVAVEHVSCLGHCNRGSAALVDVVGREPVTVAPVTIESLETAIETGTAVPSADEIGGSVRLLSRVGVVDPASLDDYRMHGGYEALKRALDAGPATVIQEVEESQLRGRGGAAFPAGQKWSAVARANAVTKYVVCNADESEPGTFKDRIVLENDPYALVEALTISAFAVGASRGYVYVRGEYPVAAQRMECAISEARRAGLLGNSVLASDFAFDMEVRRGGGAYICGEETALFNSIEGFRGEPRSKPPFPTERGLFGGPTVVNNVETLLNILPIVLDGGQAFAANRHGSVTGSKLFPVSGRVVRPGLYEAPPGTSLGEIIRMAGGVIGTFRAALIGGAAGEFVGPDGLDRVMSIEYSLGQPYGSGAIVVFDDTSDMDAVAKRIAAFFEHESCGQCVPCRIGTSVQHASLDRFLDGDSTQRKILEDVDRVMTDSSICGLGRTAASAIRSALKLGLIGGAA